MNKKKKEIKKLDYGHRAKRQSKAAFLGVKDDTFQNSIKNENDHHRWLRRWHNCHLFWQKQTKQAQQESLIHWLQIYSTKYIPETTLTKQELLKF